jgi:hypothetical protein
MGLLFDEMLQVILSAIRALHFWQAADKSHKVLHGSLIVKAMELMVLVHSENQAPKKSEQVREGDESSLGPHKAQLGIMTPMNNGAELLSSFSWCQTKNEHINAYHTCGQGIRINDHSGPNQNRYVKIHVKTKPWPCNRLSQQVCGQWIKQLLVDLLVLVVCVIHTILFFCVYRHVNARAPAESNSMLEAPPIRSLPCEKFQNPKNTYEDYESEDNLDKHHHPRSWADAISLTIRAIASFALPANISDAWDAIFAAHHLASPANFVLVVSYLCQRIQGATSCGCKAPEMADLILGQIRTLKWTGVSWRKNGCVALQATFELWSLEEHARSILEAKIRAANTFPNSQCMFQSLLH